MAYLHFMMFSRVTTGLCILILLSCKTSKQVTGTTGTYQAGRNTGVQLLLKTDSTFEWIYPGSRAMEIGTSNMPRNLNGVEIINYQLSIFN